MTETKPEEESGWRKLKEDDDAFKHNVWDEVEWTQDMHDKAEAAIQRQRDEAESSVDKIEKIEDKTKTKWDHFYRLNQNKFFKDRKWLLIEFPELSKFLTDKSDPCHILEVGCGVGNAISLLRNVNKNKNLEIFCCDISPRALEILEESLCEDKVNLTKVVTIHADVANEFEEKILPRIFPGSLDFITLIFTLSALKPESMPQTIIKLSKLLKPGGMILFKDYARLDLAQLRFKPSSYLSENYYVRHDGTTSYFFQEETLDKMFCDAGLTKIEIKTDKKLIVNRAESLKMCRCWMQAKYKKV